MSGHSKWAKIKRQKSANDVAKGANFAKLTRSIIMAVGEGGGIADPDKNVKLRLAVEKAKENNVPKDTIERAIEKGAGPNKEAIKEVIYEAFGPSGIAILIVAATDNNNRTIASIRNVLDRNGGKIASQGAVGYLFQHTGTVTFDAKNADLDSILMFADAVESLDVEQDDESVTVYLPFKNMGKINQALGELKPNSQDIEFKPQTTIKITSEDQKNTIITLLEALEELDDVNSVYVNAEFTE
jgi:YebC/PmpR family DNA-binding regulatory protein